MRLLRTFQLVAGAIALGVLSVSCGGSVPTPTAPTRPTAAPRPASTAQAGTALPAQPAAGVGTGAITAEVNGAAWRSAAHSTFYWERLFSLAAFAPTASITGISLSVGQVTGPGTYSLNYLNTNASAGIAANAQGHGWTTGVPLGGIGTVTITTLTASHAAGTFSFEAVPSGGGATGTIRVTNGKFDVTY